MLCVCARMPSVYPSYALVIRMSLVCARMTFVCHSYALVCHSYVTRMYSYIIRMSLVCTCMSLVCHSYVLVCHSYVTHMYSFIIRLPLVCTRISPYDTRMWFYDEPKKKDVFVIFLYQETKNSNLFDKNCTQENVNVIFNMKKVDLDES